MELKEAKQILKNAGYQLNENDNLTTTQKLKNVLVSKLQENGYTDLKASRTKDIESGVASKFKVFVNGGDAVIEYNDYDEEFTVFIGDNFKTLYHIDEVIEFLNNNLMVN